ncbi:HAD family hydrolase [Nocardia sp. NPDC088792]|uniref:HAD family hydrolase n=1 Tax=Nocardia sp. NPDC088792 TaxID=3364332 RepID=UPI003806D093
MDMFGTLVTFESRGRSWRAVLANHGIALDDRIAARYVSQAADGLDHTAHSRTRETYTEWEKDRIAQMIRAHSVHGDIGTLVDEVHSEWSTWKMRPYPEVASVLAKLRQRGIATVVCTNWTWDAEKALAQAGLLELVDGVVVSARVGARKPHPRMFDTALATSGTAADATVFVGDDWTADVLGSLTAGMRALHIDRQRTAPEPLHRQARRSSDLWCLPTLIDELPW